MAIASEIIGKLGGGAGVEVTPVSGTASGGSGSEVVMHTVEVPAGETWLVVVYGNLNGAYSDNYSSPQIYIGDTKLHQRATNGINSLAHVGAGTINVKLRRNTGNGSDSFTGHVYAVKL